MTKTLTGYDVLVYDKDILNNVIFAFKMSLLSEETCINPTYVMSWL